jgi:hypothetical protein
MDYRADFLSSLDTNAAVLDKHGNIVAVNGAWIRFGCDNVLSFLPSPSGSTMSRSAESPLRIASMQCWYSMASCLYLVVPRPFSVGNIAVTHLRSTVGFFPRLHLDTLLKVAPSCLTWTFPITD